MPFCTISKNQMKHPILCSYKISDAGQKYSSLFSDGEDLRPNENFIEQRQQRENLDKLLFSGMLRLF